MKKKFSIIIPYYHGEKFYPNLLQSILTAIKKCATVNNSFEVITIVDSVGTSLEEIDKISRVIFSEDKNITIRNFKNDINLGVAATRNKAIRLASGDFLHIIDQDDEVSANIYCESQKYLATYNFLLFNGLMRYHHNQYHTHKIYYFPPVLTIKGLIKDDFIRSPGQVVFAKELLHEKLFPEPKKYKGADDRFFWLRLFIENKESMKAKYISAPCYIANIHADNYSNDRANLDRSCLENWSILMSELDVSQFSKMIADDILRVSYKLKMSMSAWEQIKAFYLYLLFNLKFSKMLRFIIKRIKT